MTKPFKLGEQAVINTDEWKDTNNEMPTNFTRFFDYQQCDCEPKTFYNRTVKKEFENIPIELLKELSEKPCLKHKFKNGRCILCGAVEDVCSNWKKKGKLYLGNSHLIDLI